MNKLLVSIILLTLIGCSFVPNRDPDAPIDERLAADRAWYCGEGMLGIRAVARGALRLIGLWVPNTCKVIDAVISEAEAEEAPIDD